MRIDGKIVCGALILAVGMARPNAVFAQTPPTTNAPTNSENPKAKPTGATAIGRTLTITVPEPGEYFVRLPNQLPVRFTDQKTTITLDPAVGKSARIAVDDAKTGNTAVMPLPTTDTLDLHHIDFDYVHTLKILITYDSKPVQVAQVTLTADKTTQTKIIGAAEQGVAAFEDVPAGKVKVTIKYGDGLTMTQDIQVTSDHPAGVVTVPIAVSNKVPTLDVPVAPTAAPTSTTTGPGAPSTAVQPGPLAPASNPPSQGGGGITGLLGLVLACGVAVGAIYLLFRWAQSGGMAATLKKAGIEVSGTPPLSDAGTPWQPNASAPPVVSDPSLCQFCGQRKDAAGNCACTLSGAALNTGPTSPAIPTQPRLVATLGVYSGTIFPLSLNGSGLTLGRDAGNGIALSNDTTVSRRHAAIRVDNGNYVVSDEGSSNGVYVNGVRINGSQTLRPGDEVQIGNTRFRFEV